MKKNKTFLYIGITLIVIGICILAYPIYTNFVMKRQESQILEAWENQLNTEVGTTEQSQTNKDTAKETKSSSESSGITGTTLQNEKTTTETLSEELFILDPNKKVPFKILIPKIGIEWVVHEGTSVASLKRGPGHYVGTALPGEVGLCVISGHRTTYGAPFNKIDKLEIGDEIILQTAKNENFKYIVTGKTEVKPNDTSVLQQTNYPSLALTTCTPKFYATRRLIVFANMVK
jgi:LPXTG-site transpeptidase (sortase) family protein